MALSPIGSSSIHDLFAPPSARGGGLSSLFRGDAPAGPAGASAVFQKSSAEPGRLASVFQPVEPAISGPGLTSLFGQLQTQSLGGRLQTLGLGNLLITPGSGSVADLFANPAPAGQPSVVPADFLRLGAPPSGAAASILDIFFRPQFELIGDVINTFG